jgi:hypothetical protein
MAVTPTVTYSRDNSGVAGGSTTRDELINFNQLVANVAAIMTNVAATGVVTPGTLARGTTVTLATGAQTIQINGVPAAVTAQTAQAFGSLGTIPASTWGLISVERVAAGTTTFVSAAANYTTGYATEAAALAAIPAITANKVRVGYLTILASASGWVAGTDALAGGTGGNPSTTTNYYNDPSMFGQAALTAKQIGDENGVVITQ